MEVGYSSLGTFSDLFARRIGVTPSKYRERARAQAAERARVPAALAAGCFALMCGPATKDRNFREAADPGAR
jgi:AraC-like DNA-binding protein